MITMHIQHHDQLPQQPQKGEFFINDPQQKRIAEMTYFWNSATHFSIDHTWVDDSLRGQGVARQLFDAAIRFAREKKVKIIPICSYAVVMFQRDRTIADLLYTDYLKAE